MKVYELMNALAELPSGAEVFCFSSTTVNELKSGIVLDYDNKGNNIYEIRKPLDSVEKGESNNCVYLDF